MYRYSYLLPIILPNCETNDAIIYHKNPDYHHPNYRIKSTIFLSLFQIKALVRVRNDMYHDGTKRPSSISYYKMTGQGGIFPFCISRMTVDYATVRSF